MKNFIEKYNLLLKQEERNLNILKTIKEVDSSVKTYSSLHQRKQNQ